MMLESKQNAFIVALDEVHITSGFQTVPKSGVTFGKVDFGRLRYTPAFNELLPNLLPTEAAAPPDPTLDDEDTLYGDDGYSGHLFSPLSPTQDALGASQRTASTSS